MNFWRALCATDRQLAIHDALEDLEARGQLDAANVSSALGRLFPRFPGDFPGDHMTVLEARAPHDWIEEYLARG